MSAVQSYLGAKNGSGVYQAIINLMPPHDTYIEAFRGTGAVLRRKPPASRNITIDKDSSIIDRYNYGVPEEFICGDAVATIAEFDYAGLGRTLIYCDPPYLHTTRTSKARYKYEMSDNDHKQLLQILKTLSCYVILSGYRNDIYDSELKSWWQIDFQSMTRGGVRTETVWCNFEPGQVHYHTYAGKDFTDRQRIKRKAERWAKNFALLPTGERQAVLSALLSVE